MSQTVHVFSGKFDSCEDACQYTEKQWEPEPDESVSDEEYKAWEDRNPIWQLREDLDVDYLSGDFIETIDGENRIEYLEQMLTCNEDRQSVRQEIPQDDNLLVLIFDAAFDGHRARMSSTSKLRYIGKYKAKPFC